MFIYKVLLDLVDLRPLGVTAGIVLLGAIFEIIVEMNSVLEDSGSVTVVPAGKDIKHLQLLVSIVAVCEGGTNNGKVSPRNLREPHAHPFTFHCTHQALLFAHTLC